MTVLRSCTCRYGMSSKVGQVSLDYEDDGRSISSETRSVVEEEVRGVGEEVWSTEGGRAGRT